jgi:rhodanese-related sulfurtransferase
MKTAHDLVLAAKQQIRELTTADTAAALPATRLVLDVREPEEFAAGHLPGAISVPRGLLEFRIAGLPGAADVTTPIVVYCKSGGRAALAAQSLQALGYTQVASMAGGFDQWAQEGRAVQKPAMPSFD